MSVLVVGAGPSGLAAAISLKRMRPACDVCVIDKAGAAGNHNLSGAVLEPESLHRLLDLADPQWRSSEEARQILARRVEQDDVMFLVGGGLRVPLSPALRMAAALKLNIGAMLHKGDYIVSVSRLTRWLAALAERAGVEVLHGFAAQDIMLDETSGQARGVRLVDRGRDKTGSPQPNFAPGELVEADVFVLAEGCDGLVSERFIKQAGLQRRSPQLYSVGIKEVIRVTDEQYAAFGDRRVVHTLGYPLWTPLIGPGMFGGGILYSYGENLIAAGIIVAADWPYNDFNPQDALTHFKRHPYVQRYLAGGTVSEAGAKMIPEGGCCAIPREPRTGAIGKGNVLIVGDSAGLVNMLKVKGLHNAVDSGRIAAEALAGLGDDFSLAAVRYQELLDASPLMKEMRRAAKFRQTVARLGNTVGLSAAPISRLLPAFSVEADYHALRKRHYCYKGNHEFDKDTFTALAHTEHREEQPCHLQIRDPGLCARTCADRYQLPCITFCPAGVYESIQGVLRAANPSNCLHCKTCQRKCPLQNIEWVVPEGGGGPRYKIM